MFVESPMKDLPRADESSSGVAVGGNAVRATISGPKEQFVKVGSTVTFECKVSTATTSDAVNQKPPHPRFSVRSIPHIHWQHDGLPISFQVN